MSALSKKARSVTCAAIAVAIVGAGLLGASRAAAQATYSRTTAPAQAVGSASVVLKPQLLTFNFGSSKATLGPKGEWSIEGNVSHRGLLCGEHSLGVRFGIGRPGCSNVAWISDVLYATNQLQCNNAQLFHSGGDIDPDLATAFRQVSCAERVERCTGNCR